MKKTYYLSIASLLFIGLLSACDKFLEEKSDKRLSIPTTLREFQALLNQAGILNVNFVTAGEVSSDDYYLTDADLNALTYESDKRLYTWQPDYVSRTQSSSGDEWYNTYRPIYVCNAVLHGIEENNLIGKEADNIKGQALAFRAARYLAGVQIWAPAYNKQTAHSDLGMVLRLDPDMNLPSVRATVQETYDLIIKDLIEAIALLPTTQPGVTLPTKGAAHGMLARTFLYMAEYESALEHVLKALEYNSMLIDFNTLNANANFPIPVVSEASAEIVFWNTLFFANPINSSRAKMNPSLYNLYADDDLRKSIYFKKNNDDTYFFRGTHTGNVIPINGITTSELYLILSECYARLDRLNEAGQTLNQLLSKRWVSGSFVPYTFTNKDIALNTILEERRKELVMRGLRWADIKRFNRDGANITLTRIVDGQTFTLPPNDLRYAIAIPEDVIKISGIQQNPR